MEAPAKAPEIRYGLLDLASRDRTEPIPQLTVLSRTGQENVFLKTSALGGSPNAVVKDQVHGGL